MTSGHLLRLWTKCQPGKGAVFRGEAYEPLAAIYPHEILSMAESRTKNGDYSFQNLISEAQSLGLMNAVPITPSDALLFRNWNKL
jgi:molybdopterin-guanine dinucleotide biosynthesis protein A